MDTQLRHKLVPIEISERTKQGGRITINTISVDRDKDRVMPAGGRFDNYMQNPIVQWGHNYRDPWATIGRTKGMERTAERITAEFELRPAANEQDPQNIVLLLWDGGWIRTASIGFQPLSGAENEFGGFDFTEWDLLEWSLVPIPSNQDALRLAVKGLDDGNYPTMRFFRFGDSNHYWDIDFLTPRWDIDFLTPKILVRSPACRQEGESKEQCMSRKIPEIMHENPEMSQEQAVAIAASMCETACSDKSSETASNGLDLVIPKRGRVLSAANEAKIKLARDNLTAVLEQLGNDTEDAADSDKSQNAYVTAAASAAAGLEPKATGEQSGAISAALDHAEVASMFRKFRESMEALYG